jgi:hypothetical protein
MKTYGHFYFFVGLEGSDSFFALTLDLSSKSDTIFFYGLKSLFESIILICPMLIESSISLGSFEIDRYLSIAAENLET